MAALSNSMSLRTFQLTKKRKTALGPTSVPKLTVTDRCHVGSVPADDPVLKAGRAHAQSHPHGFVLLGHAMDGAALGHSLSSETSHVSSQTCPHTSTVNGMNGMNGCTSSRNVSERTWDQSSGEVAMIRRVETAKDAKDANEPTSP